GRFQSAVSVMLDHPGHERRAGGADSTPWRCAPGTSRQCHGERGTAGSDREHARVSATKAALLSVIVPVGARHTDIGQLYDEYRAAMLQLEHPLEFIFV